VVQQSESLWTFLTARQHIMYAARLYQPSRDADTYVDAVLKEMGLLACQHVKAGNQFIKGLSGGQRRRLSLAVALTKEPSIVFLDEPTSGLDAAAAASIMTFLKESAPALGVAMVCTVHQPSTSVFAGFDKVCFLTGGKICYLGAAAELAEYLAEIGRPVAPNSNPADFMLDLINRDFVEETTVDFMVAKWAERAPKVEEAAPSTLPAPPPTTACVGQLRVLLGKHSLLVLRDPSLYSVRFVIFLFAMCFVAILYYEQSSTRQDQALGRVFYSIWVLAIPDTFCLVTVYTTYMDFQLVKREVKDGMYGLFSFILVQLIIQIPMLFILSIVAIFPASFGIGNWPWESFAPLLFVYTCKLWAIERMAMTCCIGVPDVLLGLLQFMNLWFSCFIFNGIAVPRGDVIWPFRLFTYVLPYMWSQSAITHLAIVNTDNWEGAHRCDAATGFAIDGPNANVTNSTVAFCNSNVDEDGNGFYCPDIQAQACFGRTGKQVLTSLSGIFDAVTAGDIWFDYAMLTIAIGLVLVLQYTGGVTALSSLSAVPNPPKLVNRPVVNSFSSV